MAFEIASSTAAEPAESYDAIFCLAVLRHGDLARFGADRCDALIHFADFERTVQDFARCLNAGGLLFLTYSNFRLADTAVSSVFDVVLRVAPPTDEADERMRAPSATTEPRVIHDLPDSRSGVPIFGRDNRLLPGVAYADIGFRKRRALP